MSRDSVGEKTPAGGWRFPSPQAAAVDVAGMGLVNQTYLEACKRDPGAVVLPVVPPGVPKSRKRNPEANEELTELD